MLRSYLVALASLILNPHVGSARAAEAPNLWRNSDLLAGNPDRVLVSNDALDAVGLSGYVAQQATLTPFMSVQRFADAAGRFTIRITNGLPSFTPNTITAGTKEFDVGPGMNFASGINVTVAYANDPLRRNMSGRVISYSGSKLTVAVSSIKGAGTYYRWSIGRVGTTHKGQTFKRTLVPSAAGDHVLHFQSTKSIHVGSAIEVGRLPLPKAPYVVSKTAGDVTMSVAASRQIPANTRITFYGDQGVFLYENFSRAEGAALKFGTLQARTLHMSFKVRSAFISGTASIMFLGYNSLYSLGRSYTAAFPVTERETRQRVSLDGDTVGAPRTWEKSVGQYPYASIGFVWESQGTPTAVNIPPARWVNTRNVGGSSRQTLDIGNVVGAWVEVSEISLSL